MNKFTRLTSIAIALIMLTACSLEPSDQELHQQTTEQLVTLGKSEFEKGNYTDSSLYLHEASKRDNPEALYALGYMYYYGLGVNKDVNLSRDLIRRSAAFGHRPAVKALRLFIATKSTFNANTSNVDYIAKNDLPTSSKQTTSLATNTHSQPMTQEEETKEVPNINNNFVALEESNDQPTNATVANVQETVVTNPNKTNSLTLAQEASPILPTVNNASTPSTTSSNTYPIRIKMPTPITLNTAPIKQDTDTSTILDNDWLKKQNPNDYTIQITARKSLKEINDFIDTNNLNNKVELFSYLNKNQVWYGAGIGVYKKPSEAYQALLNDMPSELKAKKPWVRQFKNIQVSEK